MAIRASKTTPLATRVWARIDTSGGPQACWPWTGARNKDGYGTLKFHQVVLYVHRIVFAMAHGGFIPAGHFVLHSCDNPPCCNPAHLSNGTNGENVTQAWARGLLKHHKGKRWGGDPLELKL